MGYRTEKEAIKIAKKIAKKAAFRNEPLFVIYYVGKYQIATGFDLDTWFAGIHQNNIVYCTQD